jgi:hypothetical protein
MKDHTPAQRLVLLFLAVQRPGGVSPDAFMVEHGITDRTMRRAVASLEALGFWICRDYGDDRSVVNLTLRQGYRGRYG